MNKSLDTIVLRYVGFGLLLLFLMVMGYLVRGALPVFVVGGVIAFAMEPVLQKMEKRGHSRVHAVSFVAIVVALIGCIFFSLFAAAFQQGQALVRDAPAQFKTLETIVQNNREKLNRSKIPKAIKDSINESIDPYLAYLGDNINKRANELSTQTNEEGEAEAEPTPTLTPKATPTGTPSTTPEPAASATTTDSTTQLPTSVPKTTSSRQDTSAAPKILAAKGEAVKSDTSKGESGTETLPAKVPEVAPARVGELAPAAVTMVTALGSFLAHLFLTIIVAFGFMLESQRIKARLLMLVPPLYRRDITELSTSINEILGGYVRGQLIVCATFGVLCTIAFEIISYFYGMQYPLVVGVFAGIIYVLPYVGLAITFVLSAAVAYFTSKFQLPAALAAMVSVVVFNLMMDYIVSPRVLGRGVGLHPLMVIFAILCGFELGGPLGTVAAVPVFAALRVIAIYLFPQLAAPLPNDSAHSSSLDKPHGPTSETTKRVADAEANATA